MLVVIIGLRLGCVVSFSLSFVLLSLLLPFHNPFLPSAIFFSLAPSLRFKWQKISRIMNGTRTPRQVASRVQKCFEKLKKFGVEGYILVCLRLYIHSMRF